MRLNCRKISLFIRQLAVGIVLASLNGDLVLAQTTLDRAEIYKVRNQVDLNRSDRADWKPAQTGDIVVPQDSVRTGANSRAELLFNEGTLVRTAAGTIFRFPLGKRRFELTSGAALIIIRPERGESTIFTPEARIVTQGTALFVQHDPTRNASLVGVLTESPAGLVKVKNLNGEVTIALQAGQFVSIVNGVVGLVEHFVLPMFYETTELAVGLAMGQEKLIAQESPEVRATLAAVRTEAVAPLQNQLAWLDGFCKFNFNPEDLEPFLQLFGISLPTELASFQATPTELSILPLRSLEGLIWLSNYCKAKTEPTSSTLENTPKSH